MEAFILGFRFFFAALFMFAGAMHIVKPKIFKYFIPDYLPKRFINYFVGGVEFCLGLGLTFTVTVKISSLGILFLMIILLPIHIWDATKIRPAIGKKWIAYLRIPIQFFTLHLLLKLEKIINEGEMDSSAPS